MKDKKNISHLYSALKKFVCQMTRDANLFIFVLRDYFVDKEICNPETQKNVFRIKLLSFLFL